MILLKGMGLIYFFAFLTSAFQGRAIFERTGGSDATKFPTHLCFRSAGSIRLRSESCVGTDFMDWCGTFSVHDIHSDHTEAMLVCLTLLLVDSLSLFGQSWKFDNKLWMGMGNL